MVAVPSEFAGNVIEVAGLTRRFGPKVALDDVRLAVPRGGVFGLVGVNGAGKTTLIKHVLGLLRAQSGSVRVFGMDPAAAPAGVLSRVGYLSEEPDLPGWMRVGELFRYTRAFSPNRVAAARRRGSRSGEACGGGEAGSRVGGRCGGPVRGAGPDGATVARRCLRAGAGGGAVPPAGAAGWGAAGPRVEPPPLTRGPSLE